MAQIDFEGFLFSTYAGVYKSMVVWPHPLIKSRSDKKKGYFQSPLGSNKQCLYCWQWHLVFLTYIAGSDL